MRALNRFHGQGRAQSSKLPLISAYPWEPVAPLARRTSDPPIRPRRDREDGTENAPLTSNTTSDSIAAVDLLKDTLSRHEHVPSTGQSRITTSNPLMRIASIIDGLLGDTQHELEALSKILEQFKEASRIRRRLLPDLKDCRRAGVALQSQIKEDRSNLGDFDKVVDKLDHYIKELEQVAGRASYFLQSDLVIMVRGRSGTEENLDQAARRLQTKLQEVSPTVEVLKLSVHAAASREKQLQEELKDMKLQLASGGSSSQDRPQPQNNVVQPKKWSSRPVNNVRSLSIENLGHRTPKPYMDIPQAYVRRHEYLKRATRSTETWLVHNQKFLHWFHNEAPILLCCKGGHGFGKSVIAAGVVDWLQHREIPCAYFHFGIDKVQTATGVALALLSQLCTISGYSPRFLESNRPKSKIGFFRSIKTDESHSTRLLAKSQARPLYGNVKTSSVRVTVNMAVGASGETSRIQSDMVPTTTDDPSQHVLDSWKTVEGADDGIRSVPHLNDVTEALHSACYLCKSRPYIILDGWDENNMHDPDEFRILLKTLEDEDCKIFLTTRSVLNMTRDRIEVINLSLWSYEEASQQRLEVVQYVADILETMQNASEPEGSVLKYGYLPPPEAIAELSRGSFDLANKVLFYLALGKGRISAASFSAIVAGNAGYNLEERLMQPAVGLSTKVMSGKEGAIFLFISWLLVSPVPLDSLALDVLFVKVYHNWKRPVSPKVGPARDENEVQPSDRTDQWDLSARSILESCGPLVVVDAGNGLLHFTSPIVQRHFVQSVSDQERSRLAASVITTCLDYLANTKDFPQGCYATEKELAQLLKQHPVLYHVAYLASYFALIQDGDCQESGSVYGKMFDALSSPKRLLMTQLLLYVREDDYEEYNGLRWDEFVLRIETMSKLHLAALWGQIRLVQAFLDEDSASAASTNSVYSTPLHEAAKFSSSVVVKTILRAKPDIVHSVDSEGNTPLHYACRAAKMDTIVLLFESRCTSETLKGLGNIKLTDIGRALPRYCFAKSGLKEAGDLAHCKGVAMLRAIEDGLDVIAELLIDEGANVNTMVENGASALYTAVQKGQDGLAAMLLARGADPTTGVPADQEPVLHSAMRKHMPSTIRELLDNPDHDINYKDSKGRTALFTALDLEDEEWAKVIMNDLLDHGLDVDIRDNDDLHIMHVAAEKGYMDLFSAISYQSRLAEEPKDKAGRTPFDIARDRGHWDIATFIRPTYEFSTQYGIPAVLLKRS